MRDANDRRGGPHALGQAAAARPRRVARVLSVMTAVAALLVCGRAGAQTPPPLAEAQAVASAWVSVAAAVASLPDNEPVVTESAWLALRARLDVLTSAPVSEASFALEVRLQMSAASMDLAAVESMLPHPHGPDAEAPPVPVDAVRSVRRGETTEPLPPAPDAAVAEAQQPQRRTVMVAPAAPRPTRRVVVVQQPAAPAESRGSVSTREVVAAPVGEVWVHPVTNPRVTSGFGPRTHPVTGERGRMHRGVDFGGPTGTPILAPASGRVVAAGWCDRATGNCIVIDHANGWRSQYFHLSRVDVRPGATVTQGQQLGAIGSTGRSTGPHLHFQVGRDGRAVDPMGLFGRPLTDVP